MSAGTKANGLFSLDPETSRREQYRRSYKLNVVQIPVMRVIGFVAMTLAALLYDLNLPVFPLAGFLTLSAINIGYGLVALVAVRALYDRAGRFDLTLLFLHLDVVMWLFTMHHVSAADQLFAFFLLVRVGDQVGFGFRRAFYFTHVVVATYLAYLWWLSTGSPGFVWAPSLYVAATMYVIGTYIAVTGIAIESLRKRSSARRPAGARSAASARSSDGGTARAGGGARTGEDPGREREPGQVRVPGDDEPRDPDADERRHRHDQPAARHAARRRAARVHRDDPRRAARTCW